MIISRGTKCFSAFHGTDISGAFPRGFLNWVKEQGWFNGTRVHLCSGRVDDKEAIKVDIRPEMEPNIIADATKTGLMENKFDCCMIDPPYSAELAQKLYKTGKDFHSINAFLKEGVRITKPNGFISTLSYEIPKIPKETELIAVWGIYTVPHTAFMRCFAVFKKISKISTGEKQMTPEKCANCGHRIVFVDEEEKYFHQIANESQKAGYCLMSKCKCKNPVPKQTEAEK